MAISDQYGIWLCIKRENKKKKTTAVSKAWNSIANQEHKSKRKVKYTLKIYKNRICSFGRRFV